MLVIDIGNVINDKDLIFSLPFERAAILLLYFRNQTLHLGVSSDEFGLGMPHLR